MLNKNIIISHFLFIMLLFFFVGCQQKTSSSSSSDSNSSDTDDDTGGTSTTLLSTKYAMDGYYKLTGIVAGDYTYTMGSGTLYSKIEWKGNGVVRRTNTGSVSYSYGGYSWTIDCTDSQITDVTLYSDGYVKSITLVNAGCGSSSSSITVHWNKWAVSSIGITNTINITDSNNDTYNLYYYFTADSFDFLITNKYYGKTINQFYFNKSTESSWGSDYLSTTLSYNESYTLWGIYPCGILFDYKAVATDGTTWTGYDRNFTCWTSNSINLVSGRSLKYQQNPSDDFISKSEKFNHYVSKYNNINEKILFYEQHKYPF